MKTQPVRRVSAAFVLAALLFVAFPAGARAATASGSTTNNANTLKIAPVRTDLTVPAGTSAQVKVIVTNLTDAPVSIHPIENDFVAGDEKGTPSIILDENSYAPTHSLKRFMVPVSDFTIPAKGKKEVVMTVTVPKSAQSGGYYGALRFAPAAAVGTKSVNLSASVASLVLMTVPGPTTEKLNMTNFDVQRNGETGSNFRAGDGLNLLMRFKNEGNIQEAPFGQVYVKKGGKEVYTYSFNQDLPRQVVLPDSTRRWEVPLHGMDRFGKYTVGASLSYGSTGKAIEIEKTIWIIPWGYILAALAVVVLLIALIVFIVTRLVRPSSKKRGSRGSHGRGGGNGGGHYRGRY